jgi:hypothetical protein
MGGTKENFQHLENVQSSSLSEDKSLEAGGGVVEGGHQLEHINTVQNEVRIYLPLHQPGSIHCRCPKPLDN